MASATPHITLSTVALSDVRMNEHVALEAIDGGLYDTAKHPPMGLRRWPLYQREEKGWLLINAYGDELFMNVGSIRNEEAINAFLDQRIDVKQFAELNIDAFNAQGGSLVLGSDYTAREGCNLPKMTIGDKTHFIVDGCTYLLYAKNVNQSVDVISFDGKRVPEIEEEEDRKHKEMLAKRPRCLSLSCELGHFIASIFASDFITLQYNVESSTYVPKQAANTRLYLLYAADKTFFAQMTPFILACHTNPRPSGQHYTQIDNITISISALLLEWKHPDQEARREQRQALLDYNLTVITLAGRVRAMHDTEYKYIEVEQHDYERHCGIFAETMGREPHADFLF